ncbi:DoxX family protein [Loktanella agnita]|uniref:DoxX family protein n=1 Tax=Loktanella agnita TaxID=287097 RepID=UPI0039868D6C
MDEYSETFVRFIGVVDIAGGLGLLLPSLTRTMPRLTVLAAAACVLLQVLAIGFHAMRGEFDVLPLNAVYIALALIVLWGRGRKAPNRHARIVLMPRHQARPNTSKRKPDHENL